MTKHDLKKLALCVIASGFLVGCGSSDATSSSTLDVTVVDGYIKEANVTDANGVAATEINGTIGLYRFSSTPTYPIKVTGGVLVDTNVSFDINMSSYSGNVISPITTIVGTDATIENNLVALNGLTSTSELYANYMENNNTNLAKLAQLFYASIKDTAITSSVKTRIGTDFDATIDTNVSMLIDNIVTNIATKASTKSF